MLSRMVEHDVTALIEELRSSRDALLGLLDRLSETRIYRPTERDGWTVKHELAAVAAHDAVLLHVIEELARRPALSEIDVSRLRGETMLAAKELRLAPLRERLAAGLQRLTEALRRHDQTLERPVSIAGQPAAAVAALLREHAERTRSCSGRVEAVIA